MAKAARKLTGFLWALLIAILSFFIIFIFFPDVSNRFFGVSVKGEDVQKVVKEIGDTVSDTVSDAAGKVAEKAVEAVTEKLPEAVESSTQSVSDALKQYSGQSN
ncbi:MAG: hypothetical protein J5800_06365 [Spirochaetales bacterium]|nr:hypothetical protein [Spirochaetales bacterium]